MTVYITKYLKRGIIEAEASHLKSSYCKAKLPGNKIASGFYVNEFHLTKEAAIQDFKRRTKIKINSLKKEIEKLEKNFEL